MRTNDATPRTDWAAVRVAYEETSKSVRALAKEAGVSEGAVRKRAKAETWVRKAAESTQAAPAASVPGVSGDIAAALAVLEADVAVIVNRGRDLALRMLSELEATTTHVDELEEMISAETVGHQNGQRRHSMLQAISLPSRSMVGKNLAGMLKTLGDALPGAGSGKKEAARDAARAAGSGGRFATPSGPPRLVVNNKQR